MSILVQISASENTPRQLLFLAYLNSWKLRKYIWVLLYFVLGSLLHTPVIAKQIIAPHGLKEIGQPNVG